MLQRGQYGIGYFPKPPERPSILPWVLAAIALVTLVSLVTTRHRRARPAAPPPVAVEPGPPEKVRVREPEPAAPVKVTPPPAAAFRPDPDAGRSAKYKALVLRLEAAEKANDIEMAASSIEQIRALPDHPAGAADDQLVARLGTLNLLRLFELKTPQWVVEVTVTSGANATRIAREHGSTLALLERLNGGDLGSLRIGRRLKVMNHPRFSLVAFRGERTADLYLNGKLFRRYALTDPAFAPAGSLGFAASPRFWRTCGLRPSPEDRREIETLMPPRSLVLIREPSERKAEKRNEKNERK